MTLKRIRVLLLVPLAALFLNIATLAHAHDGHRGHGYGYDDRAYHRDHFERRAAPGRFHHRPHGAYRNYLRSERRHYRKLRRAHRHHRHHRRHHRKHRGPYIYFGWR